MWGGRFGLNIYPGCPNSTDEACRAPASYPGPHGRGSSQVVSALARLVLFKNRPHQRDSNCCTGPQDPASRSSPMPTPHQLLHCTQVLPIQAGRGGVLPLVFSFSPGLRLLYGCELPSSVLPVSQHLLSFLQVRELAQHVIEDSFQCGPGTTVD